MRRIILMLMVMPVLAAYYGCANKEYVRENYSTGTIVESGVKKNKTYTGTELPKVQQSMSPEEQEQEILLAEVQQGNYQQRHDALIKMGYKPCKVCDETGLVICPVCKGIIVKCPQCNGIGKIETFCDFCGGKGVTGLAWNSITKSYDRVYCIYCNGSGKIISVCPACKGTGKQLCSSCGNTGKAKCSSCNGTGWEGMKQKLWK